MDTRKGKVMADVDRISQILGALQAEVQENQRQHHASFKKLDAIEEKINKLAGAIELIALEQRNIKKEIDDDIKPAVQDFKNLKNKGLGIIAFIGLMGSGTGAALAKWFSTQ